MAGSDLGLVASAQRSIRQSGCVAVGVKPLDELALTRALDRLTARHEALRATAFDGDRCSVMAAGQGNLVIRDIEDRDQAVDALLAEGLAAPFDLEAGTLFRAQLLRRRRDREASRCGDDGRRPGRPDAQGAGFRDERIA